MKINLLALLLATISFLPQIHTQGTSSSSAPAASSTSTGFTVTSARSGSPIHLLQLTIFSGRFYLGGRTSSYCPSGVAQEGECPPGNETVLIGGNGLAVAVPGGQQIYILRSGALTFTPPHSAYIPPGSVTGPFTYTPGSPGSWSYTSGFMACPVRGNTTTSSSVSVRPTPTSTKPSGSVTPSPTPGSGGGRWQVYASWKNASVPGGNVDECLGFDPMAYAWRGGNVAAWEYI
ncbi:hypothetical protein BO94DRAFT_576778 [Aspergillus sclerotioniger CBS 115572]|uniref:IgE-binding protein n=1 Tax=Aspergillus sclerotioniger CBS 115572 TaxID=1450535 RepID=A0A317W2S5_9EURO|nr:hypothetical protein BO94DRAFT_576778 [Aspergillus sclerotioniger CBS 115572]PWY80886.1 hypothetical protein BO94DRAFT_576778 [Aspergillus sclerotioniger CBS 115572]